MRRRAKTRRTLVGGALLFIPGGLLQRDAGDDGFGMIFSGVVGLVLSVKWVRKRYRQELR